MNRGMGGGENHGKCDFSTALQPQHKLSGNFYFFVAFCETVG